jgi:hypothetical protein
MGTGKHVRTEEFIEKIKKAMGSELNNTEKMAAALERIKSGTHGVVHVRSLYDSSGRSIHLPPASLSVRTVSPCRMEPAAPFSLTVRDEKELNASFNQLPDRIDIGHPFYSSCLLYSKRGISSSAIRPEALRALASRLGITEEDLELKPFVYTLEGSSYLLKTELLVEPPSKPEPKPLSFLEQFDRMRESLGCVVDES